MTTLNWSPEQLPEFVELFGRLSAFVAWRYLFFAGVAWFLAYVFLKRCWFHRKVIARFPSSRSVRREMLYSTLSVFIFGAIAALTIWAARHGWTRMCWRAGERGWWWFFASVGVAILLHDACFYWTHRLMHRRPLFWWFHRIHHASKNPSPWAAYSFAPLEALVQAGIFPLAVCLLLMHPIAVALFMVWQITFVWRSLSFSGGGDEGFFRRLNTLVWRPRVQPVSCAPRKEDHSFPSSSSTRTFARAASGGSRI